MILSLKMHATCLLQKTYVYGFCFSLWWACSTCLWHGAKWLHWPVPSPRSQNLVWRVANESSVVVLISVAVSVLLIYALKQNSCLIVKGCPKTWNGKKKYENMKMNKQSRQHFNVLKSISQINVLTQSFIYRSKTINKSFYLILF